MTAIQSAYGAGSVTDWLNVTQPPYGADSTGTNDASAAIQSALNAGAGKTVYLPAGTYKIGTALTSPAPNASNISGCCLRGDGWGSILAFDQSAVSTLIAMPGTTQGKFDIRDLRIQQSGAADGGTAIDISYFINSVIDNVSVDKGSGNKHCLTGITGHQTGTEYNTISNTRVSVDGTNAQGIALSNNANSNTIQDARIVVGASGGTGSSGVYLAAHSNRVAHADVESAPGNGIFLDTGASGTLLENCYAESNVIGLKITAGVQAPVVIGGTMQSSSTANIQDNGSVNPAILAAWPNSGTSILGNILPGLDPLPSDQNLLAWNYDGPSAAAGASTALATAGTVYVMAIPVRSAISVTNLLTVLVTNGGTLTTGQCFGALYPAAGGTLIAATADQAAAWGAGATKVVTMPLSGGPFLVQPGLVYAVFWFNGTTGPAFFRSAGTSSLMNIGLAGAASRWGTANTGVTTTAPPTLGAISAASIGYWAGLS